MRVPSRHIPYSEAMLSLAAIWTIAVPGGQNGIAGE